MLSKGSGLNKMSSVLPKPAVNVPGVGAGTVNIIFLDMTWHATEYWIQVIPLAQTD